MSNLALQSTPLESYAYYTNGKLGTFTDARGKVTTYHYDGFIRPYSTVYPDNTTEYVALDANGNQTGKQFRDNSVMYWTYDVLNRVVQTSPKDMVTPAVVTTYDAAGHVTKLDNYNPYAEVINSSGISVYYNYAGSVTNTFDTAGRQVSTSNAQSQALTYSLDSNGNRTRLTWPDAYFVSYGYDALNRMTTVAENGSTLLATYAWNPLSKRTTLTYGNGASATYGYDAAFNDLTSLSESFVGSSASFTYGYNKAHQITSVASTDAAFLSYPAATNSVSYTAGPLNQYTAVGAGAPTYDGRGNLSGDGINSFAYDHINRMVTATTPQGATSYGYDGLGRRVSAVTSGVTTRTLMDGQRELGQYDGSGILLSRYVYGPGLDEHIVTVLANGTKTWLHTDQSNTVIADSGSTGAVGSKYAYGPYGETRSLTGSNFRYAGRVLDANTGLYYYRARMYSPVLGRFMQTDPAGYNGGTNLYRFVNNDPLNLADPSGLAPGDVYAVTPAGILDGGLNVAGQRLLGSFGTGYSHVAMEIGTDSNGNRWIAEAVPGGTRIQSMDAFMQQETGRGSTVDRYSPNAELSSDQIKNLTDVAYGSQGLPYNYVVPLNLTDFGPTICSEYVNQLAGWAGTPQPITTPWYLSVRPVMPSDISNSDTYHQNSLDYSGSNTSSKDQGRS